MFLNHIMKFDPNVLLINPGASLDDEKKSRGLSPRKNVSAKLLPTFADRGCRVVSAVNPYVHILGFLEQGLDDMEKIQFLTLPVFELLPVGCASHSQSLYRLRCRGSDNKNIKLNSMV
jgi:hypothetical protein